MWWRLAEERRLKSVSILPGAMGLSKLKLTVAVLICSFGLPSAGRESGNSARTNNSSVARNIKPPAIQPQQTKPNQSTRNGSQESNPKPDSSIVATSGVSYPSIVPQWLTTLSSPDTSNTEQDSTIGTNPERKAAQASSIINSHNDEIKACYHDYLKLNPSVTGKMVVRIFVTPDGTVSQVDVPSSTIVEIRFQNMITDLIKQWKDFGVCGSNKLKVYRQEYVFGNEEE